MPMPSLDFLLEASLRSLQDLELASRNRCANLSKTLKAELDSWIEQAAAAMMARWMIENRDAILRGEVISGARPKSVDFLDASERKKSA